MYLSRQKILALVKEKLLIAEGFLEENLKASSYDLRIGTIYRSGKIHSVEGSENEDRMVKLGPSEIVTMLTQERVHIPESYCGTVFAINSASSKGLLILNPGHIDPGYAGFISICAINLSSEEIWLRLGDPIFTILFHELNEATSHPYDSSKTNGNRKAMEENFFVKRASKLSPSVFDLLESSKYEKSLKKVIDTAVKDYLSPKINWLGFGLALILSVVGVYEKFFNTAEQKLEQQKPKVEVNTEKEIDKKIDALLLLIEKMEQQGKAKEHSESKSLKSQSEPVKQKEDDGSVE